MRLSRSCFRHLPTLFFLPVIIYGVILGTPNHGRSLWENLPGSVFAQTATIQAVPVKTILTWGWNPASPDPSGIAYWPEKNRLIISDGEVDEMPIYAGVNIFEYSTNGAVIAQSTTVPYSNEPTGVAVNASRGTIFFSDDVSRMIYEIDPGPDRIVHTADDTRTSFSTLAFGSTDPEGLAFGQGSLFIAGGIDAKIFRVFSGVNGVFDGIAPAGDDIVTSFDTLALGERSPEGIEYIAETNALYIVGNGSKNRILELSLAGQLQQTIDISFLSARALAGLGYGTSSVNPQRNSMYIVDRGVDNNTDPTENDGKLYEVSLEGIAAPTPTPTVTAIPTPTPTTTAPQTCVFPNIASLLCYELWRREFRSEVSTTQSDYSGDGKISLVDYELWRQMLL